MKESTALNIHQLPSTMNISRSGNMKSEVARQILSDQPITYAVTDRMLRIVELGDSPALFGQPQNVERGKLLFDFAPELIGHEQDIDAILNGEIQRFEIPLVNREVEPGKVIYTTLVNLPYVQSSGEIAGILHIVEDVSSEALTEQKMLQQRNELYILQDELRKQNQKFSAAIAELQRVDDLALSRLLPMNCATPSSPSCSMPACCWKMKQRHLPRNT
mgnify:CR=1 FL=1